MSDWLIRTKALYGAEAVEKFAKARVAVFGIGGVGGHTAEGLVRSGIGSIDIIDGDSVAESNLNRQIIASRDTVGKDKVNVMKDRILSINPECHVKAVKMFILPENSNEIDFGKHYEDSRKQFKKFFGKTPEFTWDNQDIVSNDLLPFIGKIDHHLYLGSAYRGWGMTNGFLAGKIISDSILGKANPYYSLFDPNRNNFVLFTNSFLGTFHYMKVYIDSFCHRNSSYLTINGLRYILYEDKEHKKYKICLLCPHLKCHLVYNYYDKTWDCPCHGSRFLLDGTVIKGPAVFPLKKVV